MKIYYRELDMWQKACQIGERSACESKFLIWCQKHLGPSTDGAWNKFRPPRSNVYTRPEGINFHEDEYATAFLLVFK